MLARTLAARRDNLRDTIAALEPHDDQDTLGRAGRGLGCASREFRPAISLAPRPHFRLPEDVRRSRYRVIQQR
jgi:hypothetical protein